MTNLVLWTIFTPLFLEKFGYNESFSHFRYTCTSTCTSINWTVVIRFYWFQYFCNQRSCESVFCFNFSLGMRGLREGKHYELIAWHIYTPISTGNIQKAKCQQDATKTCSKDGLKNQENGCFVTWLSLWHVQTTLLKVLVCLDFKMVQYCSKLFNIYLNFM